MLTTEERLENAIKHQPDRYIVLRDADTKELIEVHDNDTGRVWIKGKESWILVD